MTAGVRRYKRPARDFSMIHHTFSRSTLPARAVKVGLYVLSHDHEFVLTQVEIARKIKMAVRTVADALRDLEAERFLVQVAVRNERGHRTGTEMHVSDVPFTDDEVADLLESLSAKSADAESADAEFAGPKKTTSKQKTNTPEEPSGGEAASPALAPDEVDLTQEDAMPKLAKQQQSLFDVEAPPKTPRTPSAADVVAAYVTAYKLAHTDREPLKQDKGRVGRDAAQILGNGQATVSELVEAATQLGGTEWANLGQQLKFVRAPQSGGSRPRVPGMAPARDNDDPIWAELARTHEFEGLDDEAEARFLAAVADV